MNTILFLWCFLARPFSNIISNDTSVNNLIISEVKKAATKACVEKRQQRGLSIEQVFIAAVGFCSTGRQKLQFTLGSFHAYLVRISNQYISDSALNKKLRKSEIEPFLKNVLESISGMIPKAPKYPFSTAGDELKKILGVSDVMDIDGTYIRARKSDKYQCYAGDGRYGIGLHPLVSIISGVIHGLAVTQQACNERLYMQIEKLKNVAIFADRGYPSFDVICQLMQQDESNNVKFLFRFHPDFTMEILSVINGKGEPLNLTSVTQDIDVSVKDNRFIDFQVKLKKPKSSKSSKKFIILRVVRIYNPILQNWNFFITNIGADKVPAYKFGAVYRLRWVCEMLYKSIKSFNSLSHGINSSHLMIVLFFLVASLVAVILKTIVASLMKEQSRSISLLKVHKNIELSDDLIIKIAFKYISNEELYESLKTLADVMARLCLQSHVSMRDKKQLKSYNEIAHILASDVYSPDTTNY